MLAGAPAVDLTAEAKAIETSVRVYEADADFGLIRLWAALRSVEHPLAARTLSFLLTQHPERRTHFAELVALDLMSSPGIFEDTSSQLNLLNAASAWLRTDEGVPGAVTGELPRFLWRALAQPPVVHDATIDVLLAAAEADRFSSFPRGLLLKIAGGLSEAPATDAPQASADRAEIIQRARDRGLDDLAFRRNALRGVEALAERVGDGRREHPDEPAFTDAARFLRRREMESRAILASTEVGAPVQAIRVSDSTPRPSFGVVSSVINSWRVLFESACDTFDLSPVMRPLEGRPGSYVINAAIDDAPDSHRAFDLLRELIGGDVATLPGRLEVATIDAKTYRTLLETLTQHGATLEVFMVDARADDPVRVEPITVTFAVAKSVLPPVRAAAAASTTLDSSEIPQADDLGRLFRLLDLLRDGVEVTPEALEVTPRQVNYYRHAGRILRLLSEENTLTGAGEQVARLPLEQRRMSVAVLFEESDCGSAWINWSRVSTLVELKPESAEDFIRAAVPTLSPVTARRRAQTLTAWQIELAPFHYTRWRVISQP